MGFVQYMQVSIHDGVNNSGHLPTTATFLVPPDSLYIDFYFNLSRKGHLSKTAAI